MKFLLDVCASSHALRTLLTDLGHDVLFGPRLKAVLLENPGTIRAIPVRHSAQAIALAIAPSTV